MRRIFVFYAALFVVAFPMWSGCGKDSRISVPDPVLYSISPDSAAFGDTIFATGAGFSDDRYEMRVSFSPLPASGVFPSGRKAVGGGNCSRQVIPFSSTGGGIGVIVPDGAFTGSVRVERNTVSSLFPFGIDVPYSRSPALPFSVYLGVGDVGRVFFSGPYYEFERDESDSNGGYLMILFDSSVPASSTDEFGYSISLEGYEHSPKGTVAGGGGRGGASPLRYSLPMAAMLGEKRLKRRIRLEIGGLLRRRGGERGAGSSVGREDEVIPSWKVDTSFRSGLVPQTRHFRVLNNVEGSVLDPDNFSDVEAELMYSGEHTLLYVDTSTQPDYFSQDDADLLGNIFDSQIYQTDRQYFGTESDINGDGKVAILLSPVINRLTPPGTAGTEGFIAGFFLANDLLPGMLDSRVTNGMEIFYCIVPDPGALYGNVFPKAETINVLKGILAHEFLHMILFNYRVLIYGNGYMGDFMEELWLNEGLAHIAEDLNGYNDSNVKRANLFLEDPGDVTLVYGGDELEERGASYLFLRYLGDRFGNTLYRSIVQSRDVGVENIENRTGERFFDVFTDWAAACYLSSTGTPSDDRYRFSSIDLQNDFDPLHVLELSGEAGSMAGSVRAMAPEFVKLQLDGGYIYTIEVESSLPSGSGRMNFAVIRLE